MSVQVKICGLGDAAAVDACVDGGARFVGFVFCEGSRHRIAPSDAAVLIARVPSAITTVGLFVDPSDDEIRRVLSSAGVGAIQLHGSESVARIAEIKKETGLSIIKAIGVSEPQDIVRAESYASVADYLLLDAKPPKGGASGGNGLVFDWELIQGASFSKPWLLAGGLNEFNMAEAVGATNARFLDVSSGVENAAGHKSPEKIKIFLNKAKALETGC